MLGGSPAFSFSGVQFLWSILSACSPSGSHGCRLYQETLLEGRARGGAGKPSICCTGSSARQGSAVQNQPHPLSPSIHCSLGTPLLGVKLFWASIGTECSVSVLTGETEQLLRSRRLPINFLIKPPEQPEMFVHQLVRRCRAIAHQESHQLPPSTFLLAPQWNSPSLSAMAFDSQAYRNTG